MDSYRDLRVWQRSMQLVTEVYARIRSLPREEMFALSQQIRRAAVSMPSNIAEGYGRRSAKEYSRFLNIAMGSKYELETQLLICVSLGYISEEDIEPALELCDQIGRMLNALLTRLTNA